MQGINHVAPHDRGDRRDRRQLDTNGVTLTQEQHEAAQAVTAAPSAQQGDRQAAGGRQSKRRTSRAANISLTVVPASTASGDDFLPRFVRATQILMLGQERRLAAEALAQAAGAAGSEVGR